MKDLTKDSISVHLLTMAAPVGVSMLAQIAYQLISLHFISKVSVEALAGVNAAANVIFIVSAVAQILSVGIVAIASQYAGAKDFDGLNRVFNQSVTLSAACALTATVALYLLMPAYLNALFADPAVANAGIQFVWWATPGYALLFPMTVISAVLRSMGEARAPALIFTLSVFINAALSAVLIPGYGFIPELAVAGAGLATTLATSCGVVLLSMSVRRSMVQLTMQRHLLVPMLKLWRRIFAIGLPAGADLALMFLTTAVVYFAIRDAGAPVQAGYGIGSRILQILLIPGLAIAFAAGPITGQNFGAGHSDRVKQVFRSAALTASAVMLLITLLVQLRPTALVIMFDTDASAVATARLFLELMSWTFVAQALVYTCAYTFQGLGNTMPALISAVARFSAFTIPALWLSQQPGFPTAYLWYLLAGSVAIQAPLSFWLLQLEFKRRLPD